MIFALPLLFAGCAPLPVTELPVVGPRPNRRVGFLIVKTATEAHYNGDINYYPHSRYTVLKDGQLVETVANHISDMDETPSTVSLPPAQYIVFAKSEKDGYVKVPVLIVKGRTTVVDLESRRSN